MECDNLNKDTRIQVLLREFLDSGNIGRSKADKFYEAFMKTVESGYWRPGSCIPTEKELAQVFPISLGTIQKAIGRLVSDRIVERKRGIGSKIFSIEDKERESWFLRFYDTDGQSLLSVNVVSIDVTETNDVGHWSSFIGNHTSYIRIKRIFSVGGELCVIAMAYLGANRFRPLLDYKPDIFGGLQLRYILYDHFNIPVLKVRQNLRFTKLDQEAASAIQVPRDHIGIEFEVYNYTFRDKPLFYQKFIIPQNSRWLNIWRPQ